MGVRYKKKKNTEDFFFSPTLIVLVRGRARREEVEVQGGGRCFYNKLLRPLKSAMIKRFFNERDEWRTV